MDINTLENLSINWENIPGEQSDGITGNATSKTVSCQAIKIRKLDFSESYEADHWCEKGHIIYVITGELIIEYKDGSSINVAQGNSLILGDNISSHKAKTKTTTQILIID